MEETREPEIIAKLNLLQEKVRQLRTKLQSVTMDLPKELPTEPVRESSRVMCLISQTIDLVDSVKDSIDIN